MTIDWATIKRVYSGKPGCGCGCRGHYWTDSRNIRRVVKVMNEAGSATLDENGIWALETDDRYFWAYTNDAP